jgi:hypothetical protein
MNMKMIGGFGALLCVPALAAAIACSSSDPAPATVPDGGTEAGGGGGNSGVVSGKADDHCGTKVEEATQAACHPDAGASDGGMNMGDGGMTSDYGDTLFNSEGDDDDCKYHVTWKATDVAQKKDVTFTVTVANKKDKSAVRNAPVRAEVFLSDNHPGPNTKQTSAETTTPGQYTVGPIQFDASGKWTVRFHFFEDCEDGEGSPHGHAAFFVQVP